MTKKIAKKKGKIYTVKTSAPKKTKSISIKEAQKLLDINSDSRKDDSTINSRGYSIQIQDGAKWGGYTWTNRTKDGMGGIYAWRDENLNVINSDSWISADDLVKTRQTFETWECIKNPSFTHSVNPLITEEEYFARKNIEKNKKLAEEIQKKHQEELKSPPYYHFKEEFPEMTWDVKRIQVDGDNYRDEVIACYYDGVRFDPPVDMGFDNDYFVLCPHTNPDIMEWAYEYCDSSLFDYRRCVMIKDDIEYAVKWFKEDYPKIVEAYNVWRNKWYRRFPRWVQNKWNNFGNGICDPV